MKLKEDTCSVPQLRRRNTLLQSCPSSAQGCHDAQVLEHRLQGEAEAPGPAPCRTPASFVGQHSRPRKGQRGVGASSSTEAGGRETSCRTGKRRALTRPTERPGPPRRWDGPHAQALPRRRHRPAKERKADWKGAARQVESGTPALGPAAPQRRQSGWRQPGPASPARPLPPSPGGPGKAAQRLRAPARFAPPPSP